MKTTAFPFLAVMFAVIMGMGVVLGHLLSVVISESERPLLADSRDSLRRKSLQMNYRFRVESRNWIVKTATFASDPKHLYRFTEALLLRLS